MSELPKRKQNRLKGFDYSQNGAYFITICAKSRAELFGNIGVGAATCRPCVELSNTGLIIDAAIHRIHDVFRHVQIDQYVIMQNHVHLIIAVDANSGRQVAAPTISLIVGSMKRAVSVSAGFSPWQKSFHDHIVRNDDEYRRIAEYIATNPISWHEDCFFPN
jgi:REP element-mobilizing transposase RayT